MDSGMEPHHSHRLEGLLPSTSPPPLGERTSQSRRTTSHFDSHTMGDHEDEIPNMSSPPHEVGEEDPTSTYDPHMRILHDLVMIPHSQVVGIGFRATRLTMNPQALVMLDMTYLISLSLIKISCRAENRPWHYAWGHSHSFPCGEVWGH